MRWTKNPGRTAGLLYLVLTVVAPLRLIYIPNVLFVTGDAATTAKNIAAHESLFRLGMLTDVLSAVILIFLVLALYRLFKNVNHGYAVLMVIVGGIMPALIDFVNVLNDAAVLILVRGAPYLSVFGESQRDALAMLFMRMHHQEIVAAEILWGLWLFPLGALAYKSGFIPRFIGVWLIINGVAYIAQSFTGFLLPQYESQVGNYLFPALLGEIALMLWLVIKGANPPSARASALRDLNLPA